MSMLVLSGKGGLGKRVWECHVTNCTRLRGLCLVSRVLSVWGGGVWVWAHMCVSLCVCDRGGVALTKAVSTGCGNITALCVAADAGDTLSVPPGWCTYVHAWACVFKKLQL